MAKQRAVNPYPTVPELYNEVDGKYVLGSFKTPEIDALKNEIWFWTQKIEGWHCRAGYEGDQFTMFGDKTLPFPLPAEILKRAQEVFKAMDWYLNTRDFTVHFMAVGPQFQSPGYVHGTINDVVLLDVELHGDRWLRWDELNNFSWWLSCLRVPRLTIARPPEINAIIDDLLPVFIPESDRPLELVGRIDTPSGRVMAQYNQGKKSVVASEI